MLAGPSSGVRLLAMLVALAFSASAHAQERDLEAAVKATFVMRFASFVQWPAESFPGASQPVVICVVGDADFARLVETASRGERIGVRNILVRSFAALAPDAGCHVLYAARSVPQTLDAARNLPVLTVTDDRRGRARGMIHFVMDDGRVRFHVDRDATDAAGLTVSSRLLSVAASVQSRRAQ